MKVYHQQVMDGATPVWNADSPACAFSDIFTVLPETDEEYSIAVERMEDGSYTVAVRNNDGNPGLLLLTELSDVQARAFCIEYLLNRNNLNFVCQSGTSPDDVEPLLSRLVEKYQISAESEPNFVGLRGNGKSIAGLKEKCVAHLKAFRFPRIPGICFIVSDNVNEHLHSSVGVVISAPSENPPSFIDENKAKKGLALVVGLAAAAAAWGGVKRIIRGRQKQNND